MVDRYLNVEMFEAAAEDLNTQISFLSEKCDALFFGQFTMGQKIALIEECDEINKCIKTSLTLLREAGKEINKSK